MQCPQCQHTLRDDARFCDHCGHSIDHNQSAETISGDPLIGHIIDSKYQLLKCLGVGGMGAVYRARRLLIGDDVAIKILHKKYVAEENTVERFLREAQAAAMIRHPNVITLYDFGEARAEDAPAYIVMELAEGESLGNLLKLKGKLEPEQAVALMCTICAGVGAAHRRGIVHRDIKPDNIIVLPPDEDDGQERVKVVDFGIAKLRDPVGGNTLTQAGAFLGTPYYVSPEQCRGVSLDARADVYSLGAMLYEMLAGKPPFNSTNLADIISKHLHEEPRPFPAHLGIPPRLQTACLRALEKIPQRRQADALELARELRASIPQALASPPSHKPSERAPAEPAKRRGDARRALGVLILLAGFSALAFYGGLLYQRSGAGGDVAGPLQPAASPAATASSATPAAETAAVSFERQRREVDRDPGSAARLMAEELRAQPEKDIDPEFLYLYGRALLLSGNDAEAARQFEKAVERINSGAIPMTAEHGQLKIDAQLATVAALLRSNDPRAAEAARALDDVIRRAETTPPQPTETAPAPGGSPF